MSSGLCCHVVKGGEELLSKTRIQGSKQWMRPKNYVSKLPHAFVLRCLFDSAKLKLWISLLSFLFLFSPACMNLPVKLNIKNMTDTIKHIEKTNFLNSVLWFILVWYLVHPKFKFHILYWSKVVTDSNLTFLLRKKKNLHLVTLYNMS